VNKASRVVFHVDSDGKPANNWSVGNYDLYDATGNHVRGYANNDPPKDGDTAAILPSGLWPGEPWKVRLEFSKKSGYDDSELWTIQNIPVTPGREQDYWNYINRNSRTNVPFAETDRDGIHLKIFGAKQFTDAKPNSNRQGVVVVQCTRAGSGRTFRGTRLANAGFLIADNLLPQKARILLSLALTVTTEPEQIARFFRTY